MAREIKPGERFRITRIEYSDPDAYAVIHYNGRWAFPCGRGWFEREQPAVGDTLVMSSDSHWRVEKRNVQAP